MGEAQKFQFQTNFLRVGERSRSGDCICLRWGNDIDQGGTNQFVMVVDGGFASNAAALSRQIQNIIGDSKIDVLLSTHPHDDHIGGMTKFIDDFVVKKVVVRQPWKHSGIMKHFGGYDVSLSELSRREVLDRYGLGRAFDLVRRAKSVGCVVEEWDSGEDYDVCGTRISVLGPDVHAYDLLAKEFGMVSEETHVGDVSSDIIGDAESQDGNAENNSCYVLAFSFPEKTKKWALLTSDVGSKSFDLVIKQIHDKGLRSDCLRLLQVPHHGSVRNVNEDQLDQLVGTPDDAKERPFGCAYAAVSVAGEPDLRHPHPLVVGWLKDRNMKVSTTRDGVYTYTLTVNLKAR